MVTRVQQRRVGQDRREEVNGDDGVQYKRRCQTILRLSGKVTLAEWGGQKRGASERAKEEMVSRSRRTNHQHDGSIGVADSKSHTETRMLLSISVGGRSAADVEPTRSLIHTLCLFSDFEKLSAGRGSNKALTVCFLSAGKGNDGVFQGEWPVKA